MDNYRVSFEVLPSLPTIVRILSGIVSHFQPQYKCRTVHLSARIAILLKVSVGCTYILSGNESLWPTSTSSTIHWQTFINILFIDKRAQVKWTTAKTTVNDSKNLYFTQHYLIQDHKLHATMGFHKKTDSVMGKLWWWGFAFTWSICHRLDHHKFTY